MAYLAGAEHNKLEVRLLGRVGGAGEGEEGGGGIVLQLAGAQYNTLEVRLLGRVGGAREGEGRGDCPTACWSTVQHA